LLADDDTIQVFYALPQPVAGILEANSREISFVDLQGLPTRITLLSGSDGEEVVVTPLLPAKPDGYLPAGHALNISHPAEVSSQPNRVDQNDEPLSFTIEIHYSEADLQPLFDATGLTLLRQSPDGWVDAQSTCSAVEAVEHDLDMRVIITPVCEWGTYALVFPVVQLLYLPNLFSAK
jgi:hypothetical protein